MLITVTSPIRPQLVALSFDQSGLFKTLKISWVPYFMDPYATYIGHQSIKADLFPIEENIYAYSNKVIVTNEIYKDNKSNVLSKYMDKTLPVFFANLKPNSTQGALKGFQHDKINCLYTGGLQDITVRNPEFLFKLISQCDHRFVFHLIVNRWSTEVMDLRMKYLKDNQNIVFYDTVSLQESLLAINSADILINLGNLSLNQLPGKVCDYIASGRPIINIHAHEEDTSKMFLKKYPCKLNLQETIDLSRNQIDEFANFCISFKGDVIEYSRVQTLYFEYTAEHVTDHFLAIVNNELYQ